MKIFLSGAIGDVFALESFFSKEIREKLTTICYATPKQQPLETLFNALPNYNLEHITVWDNWSQFSCFLYKSQCQELMGYRNITLSEQFLEAEDFGISTIFPKVQFGELIYNDSSWLKHELCELFFDLPDEYFVICPYGDKEHEDRNFSVSDWEQTLLFLKRKKIPGVILNNSNGFIPPDSSLINLSAQTTILEAVEILKAANGYIGVDTSFSVLAAKKFPVDGFLVKTTNAHVMEWSRVYFAPHEKIPFLQYKIDTSRLE